MFNIQNRKTLQHAPSETNLLRILLALHIDFQLLENNPEEQSESKRRQWLTTSVAGPFRTKFLSAL